MLKLFAAVVAALGMSLICGSASADVTLYDSGGFESAAGFTLTGGYDPTQSPSDADISWVSPNQSHGTAYFDNYAVMATNTAIPTPLPRIAWGGFALMGFVGMLELRRRAGLRFGPAL